MKAFVSSLIGGIGLERQAARDAMQTMRLTPTKAENFGACFAAPQITCLQGVRPLSESLSFPAERSPTFRVVARLGTM